MIRIFAAGLLLFCASQIAQAEADKDLIEARPSEVVIGLLPGGNPESLKQQGLTLGNLLQDSLGLPVKIFIPKSYSGLTEALKNKSVDFAFMSALSYVKAEKEVGLKVLLKKVWQDPFYYSALVSLKKNKIKSLKQLSKSKIVFVDESSTSGYLYPMAKLTNEKIKLNQSYILPFSGNHSQSLIALEKGEADVAALFSDDKMGKGGAWAKLGKLPAQDYQVLWISEPIPTDPFVVRTDFYEKSPKFVHELMFKMIDVFEQNSSNSEITKLLGSKTMMPATSRQYDSVRDTLKTVNK